jgi:hypothetical protein
MELFQRLSWSLFVAGFGFALGGCAPAGPGAADDEAVALGAPATPLPLRRIWMAAPGRERLFVHALPQGLPVGLCVEVVDRLPEALPVELEEAAGIQDDVVLGQQDLRSGDQIQAEVHPAGETTHAVDDEKLSMVSPFDAPHLEGRCEG